MSDCRRFRLGLVVLMLAIPASLHGQEGGAAETSRGREVEHRHGLALFIGNTDDDGTDAFTLGLDYEYRLRPLLGVGAMVDWASGGLRTGLVAPSFFLHPSESWKLFLAPGAEREEESGETNFVFRVGAVYVFDVGPIGIAPTVIVDFVDAEERETVYVYGIGLEWEF